MMRLLVILAAAFGLVACRPAGPQTYAVRGIVHEIKAEARMAVIEHERIPGYMDAMTMAFRVKDTNEFSGVRAGDEISFRLLVTEDESWIDRIAKTGRTKAISAEPAPKSPPAPAPASTSRHPLMEFAFTNQLGKPVTLAGFRGQALAMTFFFTRCPIPEYCPRLTKNFEEALASLKTMPGAPTNWHLISVTIDPQFDTPEILRTYARRYDHDPRYWSFWTGPADQINELARESGMSIKPDGAFLDHNFRTLIIDPEGKLRMSFPVGGDISDGIANELLKAARGEKSG